MSCRFSVGEVRLTLAGRDAMNRQRVARWLIPARGAGSTAQLLIAVMLAGLFATIISAPRQVAAGDLATVSTDVLNVRSRTEP